MAQTDRKLCHHISATEESHEHKGKFKTEDLEVLIEITWRGTYFLSGDPKLGDILTEVKSFKTSFQEKKEIFRMKRLKMYRRPKSQNIHGYV
jgi:hypothetical protein